MPRRSVAIRTMLPRPPGGAARRRRIPRRHRPAARGAAWWRRWSHSCVPASRSSASASGCKCCSARSHEDGEYTRPRPACRARSFAFRTQPGLKVPQWAGTSYAEPLAEPACGATPPERPSTSSIRTIRCRRRGVIAAGRTIRRRSARPSGATTSSPRSFIRRRARRVGLAMLPANFAAAVAPRLLRLVLHLLAQHLRALLLGKRHDVHLEHHGGFDPRRHQFVQLVFAVQHRVAFMVQPEKLVLLRKQAAAVRQW